MKKQRASTDLSNRPQYISLEVSEKIAPYLQAAVWKMVELSKQTLQSTEGHHLFDFYVAGRKQKIIHTEQTSKYKNVSEFDFEAPISATIYVYHDSMTSSMVLGDER